MRSLFDRDQRLVGRRGVKSCRERSSSIAPATESIQPKQSASSTDSS